MVIWWTGLAPWEFDFSFPGSLTSTFLVMYNMVCSFERAERRPVAPLRNVLLEGFLLISWFSRKFDGLYERYERIQSVKDELTSLSHLLPSCFFSV